MRTIKIDLFKFKEFTCQEDIDKILDRNRDINIDYSWWEYDYDDASAVNITIEEFDLYHQHI